MDSALSWTLFALALLVLVRNHIVYRIRTRRLHEIHTVCVRETTAMLDEKTMSELIEAISRRYDDLDSPSYRAMVFDIRRWTYKQFYPNPVE